MAALNRLTTSMGERLLLSIYRPYTSAELLNPVRAPEGWGVFASVGPNFQHAVFGRDSIEVAEDIYRHDRRLAHDIILTLARLQGTGQDAQNEEEPGKIHHEFRTTNFTGDPVPEQAVNVMRKLQTMWGDTADDAMLYYGSYDATPLYLRLLQKYTAEYGDAILSETYYNKDGIERAVLDSAYAAADWLAGKLNQREDHLLAYRRSNPQGIENQVWKDSRTAYLFGDGAIPDHDKGVVPTELQGYAYDALQYAAQLFPARAEELRQLAGKVQYSTIEKLWMPEQQFFAQGLGIHPSGEERVINTLTSNGALILDSKLLEDLPDWARNMYIDGVEKALLSPDFLTPAGIRCRAVCHANLLPYVDYHGSYAVWAKETADVARGLENYGRRASAARLRQNITHSFRAAGDFYELFYTDLDNTVYYDQTKAVARFTTENMGEALPVPEPGQAWSISAAIASSHILSKKPFKLPPLQEAFKKAWPIPTKMRTLSAKSEKATVSKLLGSVQSVLQGRGHDKTKLRPPKLQ